MRNYKNSLGWNQECFYYETLPKKLKLFLREIRIYFSNEKPKIINKYGKEVTIEFKNKNNKNIYISIRKSFQNYYYFTIYINNVEGEATFYLTEKNDIKNAVINFIETGNIYRETAIYRF